jgi:predicted ATPase/transcriptional regulator with XRE-family HTH domain
MSTTISFGRWLSARRHLLDLTQDELARRVGCSIVTIRKLEADDRRPSKQIAERLADQLQIAPDERAAFLQSARGQPAADASPALFHRGANASIRAKVSAAGLVPPHNLPAQLTSFVGRERELRALADLLDRPDCRLITLFGPGGVGKTRLALRAAEQTAAFGQGAIFVPLAPVGAADLLVATIAGALGLTFHDQEDERVQLLQYLRAKELLLLLDNLEHLLAGVELFAEILRDSPRVKILATSREPLNLYGEWVFDVEGLPFPADESVTALERYDAVRLFVSSAERARPAAPIRAVDFPTIARICRMVEGMPLAVELAAAWTRTLSLTEVVEEMQRGTDVLTSAWRDMPARHRSVRAVFDQSWRLLSEVEQRILRRLSVFRGRFPSEAAQQVTGATLTILTALVDKSLLRRNAAEGYDMHELVRQYAAEQLAAVPEDDGRTREAHCHHYGAILSKREAGLVGHGQQNALAEIDRAIENVRAGWGWAVAGARIAVVAQYIDGLWLYHDRRTLYREGAVLFENAAVGLATRSGRIDNAEYAGIVSRLLLRQAWFCQWLGQSEQACELLKRRQQLARGGDPVREQALALLTQAEVARPLGERVEAERCYRESLALFQATGDRFGAAYALLGLSRLLATSGAFGEANRLAQESLAISETMGDQYAVIRALQELSHIARDRGDPADAKRFCLRSLEIARVNGSRWGTMSALLVLATNGWVYGEYEEAEQWCTEGLAIARDIGRMQDVHEFIRAQAILAGLQGKYVIAEQLCWESLALARQTGERHLIAQTMILLSWTAHGQGRYAEARLHAGEALTLFESVNDQIGLILAHLGVGRAACALDDLQEAYTRLADALRIAGAIGATQHVPYILSTCAALLWKTEARVQVAELLSLIVHHPDSSRMARDEATPLLRIVEAELPPDVFAAAQERGRAQTFEAIVERFLAVDARAASDPN